MKALPESVAKHTSTARSALWTRHWATGAAHSCVGSYGDCYGGATAEFWRFVFSPLTAADRVLDLATGSGALPRLLLDLCPDTACEVDAVDLAVIEPAWLAALPVPTRGRVRLHGNQAIEQLPFADGSFDLIVSQYGIEYSDLDRSLAELLRVRAPTGRVALLMHTTNSRPVTLAGVELAHLEWLLSETGLLAACSAIVDPMARATTAAGRAALASDPQAEAARIRFNAAQESLRARASTVDGADVLFEVQDAVAVATGFAARGNPAVARERLRAIELAARDSQQRLLELRRHALTPARRDALCRFLGGAGGAELSVACGEIREQGHLMGCTVMAVPAGGAVR